MSRRVTIVVDFINASDYKVLTKNISEYLPVIGNNYRKKHNNATLTAHEEYIAPIPDNIEIIDGVKCEIFKSKI